MSDSGRIRVGIGGWNFAPWRGSFYPPGLPAAQELHYASRQLSAIEINGTFYSMQKPASFARWRDETPDDFVFSLKAHRAATHRKVLGEARGVVEDFLASGPAELGDKLGPIVWSLMPNKAFDADDLAAFMALLPRTLEGRRLRHVLDVRHPSFMVPSFLALVREQGLATVFTDTDAHPGLADATGDLVYVRSKRSRAALPEGYTAAELDALAACLRAWAQGSEPAGVPRLEPAPPSSGQPRDVFMFFIAGDKERAPAAATALLRRLGAG